MPKGYMFVTSKFGKNSNYCLKSLQIQIRKSMRLNRLYITRFGPVRARVGITYDTRRHYIVNIYITEL